MAGDEQDAYQKEDEVALSREEILAGIQARQKTVVTVDVPEWGGSVCIRRLSAAEADATGLAATRDERDPNVVPRVLAASLADADGELLFTVDDVEALAHADMAVAARVFGEIIKANGLSSPELDEAMEAFASAQPGPSSSS